MPLASTRNGRTPHSRRRARGADHGGCTRFHTVAPVEPSPAEGVKIGEAAQIAAPGIDVSRDERALVGLAMLGDRQHGARADMPVGRHAEHLLQLFDCGGLGR